MPKIISITEIKQVLDLVDKLGYNEAAKKLGKNYQTVYSLYRKYKSETN